LAVQVRAAAARASSPLGQLAPVILVPTQGSGWYLLCTRPATISPDSAFCPPTVTVEYVSRTVVDSVPLSEYVPAAPRAPSRATPDTPMTMVRCCMMCSRDGG
jgi:hypothetical protein